MNIIWIHGFGENSEVWKEFCTQIHPVHQNFFFDHSTTIGHTHISEYAEDLETFILNNDVEDPVIIGHSMGGYIALEYASKHPVQGVGLFHSSAAADSDLKKSDRERTIEFVLKHGSELFLRHFYPTMFTEKFKLENSNLIENSLHRLLTIPAQALASASESMKNRNNHIPTLDSFDFPMFQILGAQDKFVKLEAAFEQTLRMQHPNVLVLQDVAHAGMYESPDICSTFINEYLSKL